MIKITCQRVYIKNQEEQERFSSLMERNKIPHSIIDNDIVVFECSISDTVVNVLQLTLLDMVYSMVQNRTEMAFLAMYTGSPYDDSLKPCASLETALEREIKGILMKIKKTREDSYVYCVATWTGFNFEADGECVLQDKSGWWHSWTYFDIENDKVAKRLNKNKKYLVAISRLNFSVVKVFEEVK